MRNKYRGCVILFHLLLSSCEDDRVDDYENGKTDPEASVYNNSNNEFQIEPKNLKETISENIAAQISDASLEMTPRCIVQNSSGTIGHENAGEMNINCFDHAEMAAIRSALM